MSQDPAHSPGSEDVRPAFIDGRRRGLLHGAVAALAGGAGGLGAAVQADDVVPEVAPRAEPVGDAGYRLTDHVREYYAKARF